MDENKRSRYSDEELQEFKEIILEKLAKAKEIFLDIARKNVHAFINKEPLINQISKTAP